MSETSHSDRLVAGSAIAAGIIIVVVLSTAAWENRADVIHGAGVTLASVGILVTITVALYCLGYLVTDLPDDIRAWRDN